MSFVSTENMAIVTGLLHLYDKLAGLDRWSKLTLGATVLCGGYFGTRVLFTTCKTVQNNRKRGRKQRENERSLQDMARRVEGHRMSHVDVESILSLKITELIQELKSGTWKPIEVLRAYQTKALEAHQSTGCLVEAIVEAEKWALDLEKEERHGLLWGVPISIKDDVGIKGYDSAIGLVNCIGEPLTEHSAVLKRHHQGSVEITEGIPSLLAEGAIPFVKTNVPQTEMSFEPGNPINGLVHNPHKSGHGAGGSSSGEAALIALKGSLLGVGGDLAGSIRVPAHFCGVFGFKPTPERSSVRDTCFDERFVTIPIRGTWGPMAQDVDGLVLQMQALWKENAMSRADPECLPIVFDTKIYEENRRLRVGYYTDNGLFPTFPGCQRAVQMAKDIFEAKGHEVVRWAPPKPEWCMDLFMRTLLADGGEDLQLSLKYDVVHPTTFPIQTGLFMPVYLRKMLAYLLRQWSPRMSNKLLWSCGAGGVSSFLELTFEIWKYRREVQGSWNMAGLDVVICPPHALVAPPFGNSGLLFDTCIYSATYNLLHYPAGVVPMTTTTQADLERVDKIYSAKDTLHRKARKAMKACLHLPVGVMVAAPRYQDELCLRAMKILETS